MFKATESQDLHFSLLHSVCHNPIKYQKYCLVCGKEIQQEEIIKGYQYEKGKYVLISDEELEAVASKRAKTIEILSFIESGTVPSVYYDEAYYLQASTGGEKAYSLLGRALRKQKKEALCRLVLRTRPKLCLVSVGEYVLNLNTIRFASEVRSAETLGLIPTFEIGDSELELAEMLIRKLTKPFIPEQYPNTYQIAVSELVEKKLSGEDVHIAEKRQEPQVVNILEALQASLEKVESNEVPANVR